MSEIRMRLDDLDELVLMHEAEVQDSINLLARHILGLRIAMRRDIAAISAKTDVSKLSFGMQEFEGLERLCLLLESNLLRGVATARSSLHAVQAVAMKTPAEEHLLNDPNVRDQVFNLTGGTCSYCAVELTREGSGSNQFCIEHVVPVSKGGPNNIVNYVPSCRSCNTSKSDGHVLHFIRRNLPRIQTNVVPIKEAPAPLPAAPEIRIVAGDRE